MKKMSITEFANLIHSLEPVTFLFDTVNQRGTVFDESKHISATLRFSKMIYMLIPNIICLKNENDTISFENVKFIYFRDESTQIGNVFDIVCGNMHNKENDIIYTVIADCTNLNVN